MSNRKKTFIAFYLSLLSVIAMAVAAYAWMSLSSSPVVSDLSLSLTTDNALEIAPDEDGAPGIWSSILDLSDPSKNAAALKPVSFSAEQLAFAIPKYGIDGRIATTVPIRLTDQDQNTTARDTSAAADTEVLEQYLFTYTFYMRTESTNCDVSLSSPKSVDDDNPTGLGTFLIGEPVWDEETATHKEAGNGAEYALRFGFLIYGNAENPEDIFVIYEPNADGGSGTETYSIDGDGKLLSGSYKIIRQKSSGFTEADPVQYNEVEYLQGNFIDEDTKLFTLRPGEERKVTLFVWLEGQDDDCTNAISGGQLFANLQFSAAENTEITDVVAE